MLPHPTFFVKSSIYKRFGLYDIELKQAADYEMILKLLYKHNILAAYIVCKYLKIPLKYFTENVKKFKGLPFRSSI